MKKTLFFSLMLLTAAGCSAVPGSVKIDPAAARFLPPLPEGLTVWEETDSRDPLLRISLQTETGSAAPGAEYVEWSFLVPLLPRNDFRESVSLVEIAAETTELIPLNEWQYGPRSAAVNDLTPADEGYPLLRHSRLLVEWSDSATAKERERLDAWIGTVPQSAPVPPRPARWIASVGDIMLQRGVEELLINRADGPNIIFSDLLPRMRGFDLLTGNLEGAVTRSGTRTPKSYNFRFRPEVLPVLKQAGFDYVALTNNHAFDYGEEGFRDTLDHLAEAGLPTSGAGRSPTEARTPARFTLDGTEIRILALGAYPRERNGFDGRLQASVTESRAGILWYDEEALEAIRKYAAAPGVDVVLVHGGREWSRATEAEQRDIYRSLIDVGVELVFGSHPHVLQGMEFYRNGAIYYSLGNFVFNGMQGMPHAEESLIAAVGVLDGRPLYRRHIAVQIDGPRLRRAEDDRILTDFIRLSGEIPSP